MKKQIERLILLLQVDTRLSKPCQANSKIELLRRKWNVQLIELKREWILLEELMDHQLTQWLMLLNLLRKALMEIELWMLLLRWLIKLRRLLKRVKKDKIRLLMKPRKLVIKMLRMLRKRLIRWEKMPRKPVKMLVKMSRMQEQMLLKRLKR
jgi:hypothetical protein